MIDEIRDRDVTLAMEAPEPVVAEMDDDVTLEVDAPDNIEITLEQQEMIEQEFSGDNAIGMITGYLPTLAKEKTLVEGISSILSQLGNLNVDVDFTSLAKEATLLAKVAELKESLNAIDLTAIEQAIKKVENITAKEATLIQGVGDIIKAVKNIDFTDLENSIAEVKNAVANIDFSALAKESTLTQGISSVESKVEEVGNKIDNIKLPEIDTTELAKQGENQDATLTAIYKLLIGSNEPSPNIPEGVAERLALILEFFGIKPIRAYEFMTAEEVCSTLEEIMTTMDINLTLEKAKEITQQTLNN